MWSLMPKSNVINELREARTMLLDAIEDLSPDQMVRPGVIGLWSIKDVLSHLVTWEAELVTALSRLEQHKQRPPRIVEIDDIDEWNAEQYHANAARSLDAVLEDLHGVHRHLLRALDGLSDRTLDDNRLWSWMEGEPLSYLVAENAIWHEQEHAEEIREWREAQGF
jgi:uncharacterized damage-inducible protein DinB